MALGRLAALASTRKALLEDVLPSLLPRCTDRLVPVRHGAVWGVAELLIGLQKVSAADMTAGVAVTDPAVLDNVVGVVRRVQEAELYRGRGGEIGVCLQMQSNAESDGCKIRQVLHQKEDSLRRRRRQ